MAITRPRPVKDYLDACRQVQSVSIVERAERYIANRDDQEFIYILLRSEFYPKKQWDEQAPKLAEKIQQIREDEIEKSRSAAQLYILLGYGYEMGLGVEKNRLKAQELYLRAIDKGSVLATVMLANLFALFGDVEPAIEKLKESKDNSFALLNLGFLYIRFFVNFDEAYKYFKQAAEKGSIAAVYQAALLEKNKAIKLSYLDQAGIAGHINAAAYLGGILIEQNDLDDGWTLVNFAIQAENVSGFYVAASCINNLGQKAQCLRRCFDLAYFPYDASIYQRFAREIYLGRSSEPGVMFEQALMFDLRGRMTAVSNESPLFSKLSENIPWDRIRPLLDNNSAALQEAVMAASALITDTLIDLKIARVMIELVLEYLNPKEMFGDPLLQKFEAIHVRTMKDRAEAFSDGDNEAFYHLIYDEFHHGSDLSVAQYAEAKNESNADKILRGLCYENGWGCASDVKQAEKCYREAAENNDKFGHTLLGLLYLRKHKDEKNAFEYLQKAAEQNEPAAMYELSSLLEKKSEDRVPDPNKALMYLNLASDAGCPPALYRKADRKIYSHQWFDFNLYQAKKYLKKSAEQGWPEALYILGKIYCLGANYLDIVFDYRGQPSTEMEIWAMQAVPSQPRGCEYLLVAARNVKHPADVYYDLGKLYDPSIPKATEDKLESVEKDPLKAAIYYRKVMECGRHDDAKSRLEYLLKESKSFSQQLFLFFGGGQSRISKDFKIRYHAAIGLQQWSQLDGLASEDKDLFSATLREEDPARRREIFQHLNETTKEAVSAAAGLVAAKKPLKGASGHSS